VSIRYRYLACVLILIGSVSATAQSETRTDAPLAYQAETLRLAIEDMIASFGDRYPDGPIYLRRLKELDVSPGSVDPVVHEQFDRLKRQALLANPLLDFDELLLVKRRSMRQTQSAKDKNIQFSRDPGGDLGFRSNHECNSSLPREGYDNEIAILSPVRPEGELGTLYRPEHDVYVGEIDLHWDADRLLLTQSNERNWEIWEIAGDGTQRRKVSQMPDDVDSFDACYLPDGRIVFGSTASYQAVPCWHGQKWVSNLYLMNGDGTGCGSCASTRTTTFIRVCCPTARSCTIVGTTPGSATSSCGS